MELETPRCDEGPWRFDELNLRNAKPEPARVMELQCEPKDHDEVAHQQLSSNFAISFEGRLAQPRHRASKSRD